MEEVQTSVSEMLPARADIDYEAKRVATVKALDLFGESVELAYDDAVYLASLICGTPISMVSVLEETQRFKAKIGIEIVETPKEESFCMHTIQQPGLFIVPDALLDSRFRDLPLVTQNPNLRFYAGMPLSTIQGEAVGALCVCDTVPRELTEDQKTALIILSRQVAARFHDRHKIVELAAIIAEKDRVDKELSASHALLRKANERLRELSLTDSLTGCWNRRAFEERLAVEFAACERHGGDLTMLLLDIDNFKRVNDTYGHEVGDQVLRHVGDVLRDGGRGTDFACRYGGEEFAILLPRTPTPGAVLIAERLRVAIEKKWDGCPITVSIGIGNRCHDAGDSCDSSAVIRRADQALYEAKAAGKNRVILAAA